MKNLTLLFAICTGLLVTAAPMSSYAAEDGQAGGEEETPVDLDDIDEGEGLEEGEEALDLDSLDEDEDESTALGAVQNEPLLPMNTDVQEREKNSLLALWALAIFLPLLGMFLRPIKSARSKSKQKLASSSPAYTLKLDSQG